MLVKLGMFWVPMKQREGDNEDEYVGIKCAPFNYTGRRVIGFKAWNKAKISVLNRVKKV
jgi:hypothetical protein